MFQTHMFQNFCWVQWPRRCSEISGRPKVNGLEPEASSDRLQKEGDNAFWSGTDKNGDSIKLKMVNKTGKRWTQMDFKNKYWLQLVGYKDEVGAKEWIIKQAEGMKECKVSKGLHANDTQARMPLRDLLVVQTAFALVHRLLVVAHLAGGQSDDGAAQERVAGEQQGARCQRDGQGGARDSEVEAEVGGEVNADGEVEAEVDGEVETEVGGGEVQDGSRVRGGGGGGR